MQDRYGNNIFASDPHRDGPNARRPRSQKVHVEYGMVLEDVASGWVGAVVRVEKTGGQHIMELEDRRGQRRSFPLGPGFWLDGKPVEALAPRVPIAHRVPASGLTSAAGRALTHSGSVAGPKEQAKVARASRIWVEGRHDAELIQYVWGEDLAHVGVAVQLLDGVDNLGRILTDFQPTDQVRAGILVDHLIPGSKEYRVAQEIERRWGGAVLVLGHPFIDIWQAIKPERVGLDTWPDIPRHIDIKKGTLAALGLPCQTQTDVALGWKKILSRVRNYKDLSPELLGPVEALIDFVTEPGTH